MVGAMFSRMTILKLKTGLILVLIAIPLLCTSNEQLRMNEIQFIGSHNSYKQQMPSFYRWLLRLIDGEGAKARVDVVNGTIERDEIIKSEI